MKLFNSLSVYKNKLGNFFTNKLSNLAASVQFRKNFKKSSNSQKNLSQTTPTVPGRLEQENKQTKFKVKNAPEKKVLNSPVGQKKSIKRPSEAPPSPPVKKPRPPQKSPRGSNKAGKIIEKQTKGPTTPSKTPSQISEVTTTEGNNIIRKDQHGPTEESPRNQLYNKLKEDNKLLNQNKTETELDKEIDTALELFIKSQKAQYDYSISLSKNSKDIQLRGKEAYTARDNLYQNDVFQSYPHLVLKTSETQNLDKNNEK